MTAATGEHTDSTITASLRAAVRSAVAGLDDVLPQALELYRELHAAPELSGQE